MPLDVGSELPFSASCSPSRSVPPRRSRNPAALAAASATTKNPCPVRARRPGRSRLKSRHGEATPKPMHRAAPREKAVAAGWRRQFRRSVGRPCRGRALRRQYREICHHRRQDRRGIQLGSSQSNWLHEVRRIRLRCELEQFGPFLGPQRLRKVRAVGRLYRTMDGVETIVGFHQFGPARGRPCGPKLSPTPSGIAAHCHPSLCRDLEREASRIITGGTYVQTNREIRVSNLRQPSRRDPFHNGIAQRDGSGR